MDTRTLGLLNVRPQRMLGIRPLMAMVLATTAVSLAVQDPVSAAAQDGLRIKNVASATAKPTQADEPQFLVRTARVPIFVDIDLGAAGGTPAVPDEAVDRVVAALDANPRRLITLRFKGGALRFNDLRRSTREALLDKKGNEVIDAYNRYMAEQVRRLIGDVDAARAGAPIAVQGIPFEGGSIEVASANIAYRAVIDRLNAIVVAGGMMLSGSSDEVGMLRRSYPRAIAASENRAIIFAANGGWKIATLADGNQDANESLAGAASDSDELTSDGVNEMGLATGVDAVDDSAILGSIGPDSVSISDDSDGLLSREDAIGDGSANSGFGAMPSRGGGSAAGGGSTAEEAEPSVEPAAGPGESLALDGSGVSDSDAGDSTESSGGGQIPMGGGSGGLQDGWDPEDEVIGADGDSGNDSGADEVDDSWSDPASDGDGGIGDSPADGNDSDGGDDSAGHEESEGDSSVDEIPAWGGELGDPIEVSEWETYSTLRSLINSTPDGGILDVSGRAFEPEFYDDYVTLAGRSITIKGGHFTGTRSLNWQAEGGGLYSASIDADLYSDLRLFLIDLAQDEAPLVGIYPDPLPERSAFRFAHQGSWLTLRESEDVVNGDVLTIGEPNAYDQRITGMVVTDPALHAELNALFAGQDPESFVVLCHAGPNVVSGVRVTGWDSATGRLDMAEPNALNYLGYLHFALVGSASLVDDPGEYAIDASSQRLYYRPANGNPAAARIPTTKWIFRIAGGDVRFEGSTFFGNRVGSDASIVSCAVGYDNILGFDGCLMHTADAGFLGATSFVYNSHFENFLDRAFAVFDGSEIRGNVIKNTQNQSAILVGVASDREDRPLRETLVEDNLIENPASTHGQGLSLYWDTWQRAIVRHNIFRNCARSVAFQPNTNASKRRDEPGHLLFENNLFVFDQFSGEWPAGQQGFAFNGAADDHLDDTQQVILRHNSWVMRWQEFPANDQSHILWAIDVKKLKASTVRVENNIFGSVNACVLEPGVRGHLHGGNLFGTTLGYSSFGEFDLPSPSGIEEVVSDTHPQATGWASNAAPDGGPVGIRWAAYPTWEALDNLAVGWSVDYPCIPVSATPDVLLGRVFEGQDLR